MARSPPRRKSFQETGQTRLLELGYQQGVPRLLPWPCNTAICFCILSSVSNPTGVPTRADHIFHIHLICACLRASGWSVTECAVFFSPDLASGGPATLIWSWVLVSGLTFCTALSLSKILTYAQPCQILVGTLSPSSRGS